jgi:hypothetical protein
VGVSVALTVVAGAGLLRAGAGADPGFAAPGWTQPEAMALVLPTSTRIYSNFPEAIYLRTGRAARLQPPAVPGPATARLVEAVRDGSGVVVLFLAGSRAGVAGPAALTTALGLPPPALVGEFLVYGRMATTPLG